MEANNSYCGVGIAFNARIGGEERIVSRSETVGSRALWVDGKGSDSLCFLHLKFDLELEAFPHRHIAEYSCGSLLVFNRTREVTCL